MNKKRVLVLSLIFLIIGIVPLISAQYYGSSFGNIDLGRGMTVIIDQGVSFFTPIFQNLLGDYTSNAFLFTKIMLVLLLFIIISLILSRVPVFEGRIGTSYLVAAIVSILSVRFISDNQLIQGILLPYGALGVALTTILPFLIIAYGIQVSNFSSLGRRIGWGFFALIFLILWNYKSTEIGDLGNQIYIWTTVAMAIMIVFDKRIHAYFRGVQGNKIEESITEERIAVLESRRDTIMATPAASLSQEQKRTLANLDREIRRLRARKGFFRG